MPCSAWTWLGPLMSTMSTRVVAQHFARSRRGRRSPGRSPPANRSARSRSGSLTETIRDMRVLQPTGGMGMGHPARPVNGDSQFSVFHDMVSVRSRRFGPTYAGGIPRARIRGVTISVVGNPGRRIGAK